MIQRLYAIVDAGVLAARAISLAEFSSELVAAGVGLIQYRDKTGSPQQILEAAAQLRAAFAGRECRLILNDRPDLAVLAHADGVHIGQLDLSPEDTRTVVGRNRLIGLSTHNDAQLKAADLSCADYLAIGPVFSTGTKIDPDPVVGLEGVRRARELTRKPLVAIGGITRQNARSVIEAGADSVAVISGLFSATETTANVVRDFLDILG
jgi:thiamine-phosphate pyrophosphorylase